MADQIADQVAEGDDALSQENHVSRRTLLKASATAAGALALAGCTGSSDSVLSTPVPTATVAPPTVTPEVIVGPTPTSEPLPPPTPTPTPAQGPTPKPPIANPKTAAETWNEPWIWRPSEFRNDALQLNVIEHESPSVLVGFGNPGASLFGYNGSIPGPTIRMQGNETYDVRLLNHLGLNSGSSPVGAAPDPAAYPPDMKNKDEVVALVEATLRSDWCLGEHTNGVHTIHTTNMHTHGLHVRPGMNPTDGSGDPTVSDDIFARLEPAADLRMREAHPERCGGGPLEDEIGASASYQFILGDVQGDPEQPHPPGTHWYHPHAHGSTHNQVSSGLAGFLIIEGNVDIALNRTLAGEPSPDPEVPTGEYDYRERVMFVQRVSPFNVSVDQDALDQRRQNQTVVATNGLPQAATIVMRPGAIERWRILNGSVDGKGYLRFMVLRGQWVHEKPPTASKDPLTLEEFLGAAKQLLRVDDDGTRHIPTTEDVENAKVPLQQLAVDGVTLIRDVDGEPTYQLRDLDFEAAPNPLKQDFSNLAACFENAESLNACYDRPNEMYMAPANRTDMMFKAPPLDNPEKAEVYTVLAKATAIHTDNEERAIQLLQAQLAYANEQATATRKLSEIVSAIDAKVGLPENTIMGYVVVKNARDSKGKLEEPLPQIPPFNFDTLNEALRRDAPLPPYLRPPVDADLQLTAEERAVRSVSGGDQFRTRTVTYSGWGAATWPLFDPADVKPFDPARGSAEPIDEIYIAKTDNGELVLPPLYRTMAIDGRKFNPDEKGTPRMGLDTTEEWAVFNNSIALYGDLASDAEIDFDGDAETLKEQVALRTYSLDHTTGFLATRAEAQDRGWSLTTRGIDHPFHIHTNPMWVTSIEVPDKNGELQNVLSSPRWHDVVWLPRSGGRIVFRSRFPDFIGKLVNHCHILKHEDNGMMQMVEIVADVDQANYTPATQVAAVGDGSVYEPVSMTEAYRQCTRYIDDNPNPERANEYPSANGVFNPPDPS